jgi:hypothetical protein
VLAVRNAVNGSRARGVSDGARGVGTERGATDAAATKTREVMNSISRVL